MVTLITHFYNEEYLLPNWIRHHKKMFTNAILIDYGSTDKSLEIINSLAPKTWKVYNSRNEYFDSSLIDHEVMMYEQRIDGWKIVLNISEFLICSNLNDLLNECNKLGINSFYCEGAIMVDDTNNNLLKKKPIYEQFYNGFLESDFDFSKNLLSWYMAPSRSRIFHKNIIGMYHPGRHDTFDNKILKSKYSALILWYGFSPWNRTFIKRKMSFRSKISKSDIKQVKGSQHLLSLNQLNTNHALLLKYSKSLKSTIKDYLENKNFVFVEKDKFIQIHEKTFLAMNNTIMSYSKYKLNVLLNIFNFVNNKCYQPIKKYLSKL